MELSKRIGFDIDGVLADFNQGFIQRVVQVTGRNLFPQWPFDIPTWDYPQHFGYNEAEVSKVWQNIVQDETFWYNLTAYPDTFRTLRELANLQRRGFDIYFITSRPGVRAKQQTEGWLQVAGFDNPPTVLISSAKGLCAQALKLGLYIDDRDVNVVDVAGNYVPVIEPGAPIDAFEWVPSGVRTVLLDAPWNQSLDHQKYGIVRALSPLDIFE